MSNVLDDSAMAGPKQRPTFLTVLCILSFIGAGISIVGILLLTVFAGAVATVGADAGADVSGAGAAIGALIGYLLLVLVSLYGVIKMWKLKKVGFYIYAGTTALSVLIGILFLDSGIGSLVFPAIFIALYGVNLKHMD